MELSVEEVRFNWLHGHHMHPRVVDFLEARVGTPVNNSFIDDGWVLIHNFYRAHGFVPRRAGLKIAQLLAQRN